MSDSQNRILKGRAVTDEPRYCIFSFDVDLGRRQIKETICISGTQDEFALRNFSESFADFSAWAQEIRYYGKLDVRSTMDLEGVVKRLSHDVDFVDKAVEAIKTNDASKIEFVMGTELEHILGVKNVALEFFVQDKTYIKDSAASGASSTDEGGGPMIPLAFVLSPLQGVALTRIRLGERIVVKFANLKDQLTKNYRANNEPQDEKFPERSTAILKSLSEATGQNAIRAIVQLPGGALGEIIEESRNIRVRMAPAPPRHPKTSPGDVDAPRPHASSPRSGNLGHNFKYRMGSGFSVHVRLFIRPGSGNTGYNIQLYLKVPGLRNPAFFRFGAVRYIVRFRQVIVWIAPQNRSRKSISSNRNSEMGR